MRTFWVNPIWGAIAWPVFIVTMIYRDQWPLALFGAALTGVSIYRVCVER